MSKSDERVSESRKGQRPEQEKKIAKSKNADNGYTCPND